MGLSEGIGRQEPQIELFHFTELQVRCLHFSFEDQLNSLIVDCLALVLMTAHVGLFIACAWPFQTQFDMCIRFAHHFGLFLMTPISFSSGCFARGMIRSVGRAV